MMLYETFNSIRESFGADYFTSRVSDEIVQNLNSKFELREYQKEALGRFDFYFGGYQKRAHPAQLLFNMATGSGKTLVMVANILQLYKHGYRNFIFFVNSVNIIEKTKDNFLNPLSEKYLFAPKIKFGEKEVFVKEVQNFEAANPEDINILFTTIQGLHIRLNFPKENALTYGDFADKEIVLISDEAHHLQTITKKSREEIELERSWEYTVEKIFRSNLKNILLEFTATIDRGNQNIRQKYEDKIIFRYDLKQFRLDKFSKEIEVLQADLEPVDRALQAVILSQYRRKIAEKNKIYLKPALLLKSKSIKESKENYEGFLAKIKNLTSGDIQKINSRAKGTDLEKAFNYFQKENITFDNLIKELQEDFSEEKCMLLDSENVDEEKQLILNSLESKDNETRAIFAVNMLNEGWDVLNLFDIVRLYDTRDGKWVSGKYKPGNTTMGEAQLIGRGARYFPFQLDETEDKYKRKFDEDIESELRIVETLHYHSAHNSDYIKEIKSALTELGIIPEKHVQIDLFIKDSFKKTDFWKNGVVFINDRVPNLRTEIFSLDDARIERNYPYKLRTGELKEEIILEEEKKVRATKDIVRGKIKYKLSDFGENIIRGALDKFEFYKFETLRQYFPHIKSVREFVLSPNYLGWVEIEVSGPKDKLNKLTPIEKLEVALFVVRNISEKARVNTSEFVGTNLFKARMLQQVFKDKKIKIDIDEVKNKELKDVNLAEKDWYAQNEFYGTEEEQKFISFIDGFIEKLRQRYSEIVLLRNEKFFQVFDFDEGRPFEPDFIMILKKRNRTISIYQIFIEPKGDQFKDNRGRFEESRESWKQEFLLELESKADTDLKLENKHFKLIGLPFYNEKLKKEFEKTLESKVLS
ncbi:type III deoxyribonuclease [Candidatus Desantisbacteria bacterium CG1_02_38_46]|uniref:Type III deoxyribonuclease n=2 Tax=unclassified Candidatus Desantisiibacteriota TaxID=3106372 RepID=A0A1J4S954_9BACT|nr:MAG: type III deoxyribonuclease [Candidatus Desantisbacteria bacterium CG1_02_38_46]